MPKKYYNWKRFWAKREGQLNLSDNGYLFDPDSEWGKIYNPDVFQFSEIVNTPCLILLGEPGIGKSTVILSEYNSLEVLAPTHKIYLDLRSVGSEAQLNRKLFDHENFQNWKNDAFSLHLFLDSLDECLLRVDTVANLLADEFRDCPIDRLSLRIACRTAEWPSNLENGLLELWGKDHCAAYELAPLRRQDVREAAESNNLDPDKFLQEINRSEAVPLAIKPVTLEFLLNIYSRSGEMPQTRTELYDQGCLILCEEQSPSRRGASLFDNLSPEKKKIVASRIAAITIFANKYAAWLGPDQGNVPEEDITIQSLGGGTEHSHGVTFEVDDHAIRETIATGLFTSRGAERMGWAHQTYAEYLAAKFLIDKGMTSQQIMSLIVHPSDPGRRLVPQLQEAAAWLASMNQEIFSEIMKTDPEVLRRSEISTSDNPTRIKLVAHLLDLIQKEELLDIPWQHRKNYIKLKHPDLAEQLKPYITDKSKSLYVRRTAIDIAEACETKELQENLVMIALDSNEEIRLRVEAAHAVSQIGDSPTKSKLTPLAKGEGVDDPEDRLKGISLYAVWPEHLKASELFAILTPPKKEFFVGDYQMFLKEEIAEHLLPHDLSEALNWVRDIDRKQFPSDPLEELKDAIFLKAWDHLEHPGVLESFAEAALSRARNYDSVVRRDIDPQFRDIIAKEDEKRRSVLRCIVDLLSPSDRLLSYIAYYETPFALNKDKDWMIGQLRKEKSQAGQAKWAQVIKAVFDLWDPAHVNAVLDTIQEVPVLAELFHDLITPIELDSPQTKQLRENYEKIQRKQTRKRPLLDPPPSEQISTLLNEMESGDLDAWWKINLAMTLEPDSTRYNHDFETDLTTLPGWKSADERTRGRITKAALTYVLEADPKTEEWLGENVLFRPAYSGVRALRLLMDRDPKSIENLSNEIWDKWAPVIIASAWPRRAEEEKILKSLVRKAYDHVPDETLETLMIMIDRDDREHGHVFILRKMDRCWDNRSAKVVFEKMKNGNLKTESFGELAEKLVEHRFFESYEYIRSFLHDYTPEGKRTELAFFAAEALLEDTKENWSIAWPILQEDEEFGRKVLESLSYGGRRDETLITSLTEQQLAELFIWLSHKYPREKDPKFEGGHAVGSRESIGHWRDSILRHLSQRGTLEACDAIEWITKKFPHYKWLKWTLQEARAIMRQKTWIPPRPEDVLAILKGTDYHLVQDGNQLLDIVIESLNRLQTKLHAETPRVVSLWNEFPGKIMPKDESRFSDFVKNHLDDDLAKRGIIINREVEVRRIKNQGSGERTDIHVDAIMKKEEGKIHDRITVVVESKGCWHPDLNTAMEKQLVGQYLDEDRCRQGLYLVGWFNCDRWTDEDHRKKQAPKISIEQARRKFERQAEGLSKDGKTIKAFVLDTSLR
jgi:predicted NACHT family NTPase